MQLPPALRALPGLGRGLSSGWRAGRCGSQDSAAEAGAGRGRRTAGLRRTTYERFPLSPRLTGNHVAVPFTLWRRSLCEGPTSAPREGSRTAGWVVASTPSVGAVGGPRWCRPGGGLPAQPALSAAAAGPPRLPRSAGTTEAAQPHPLRGRVRLRPSGSRLGARQASETQTLRACSLRRPRPLCARATSSPVTQGPLPLRPPRGLQTAPSPARWPALGWRQGLTESSGSVFRDPHSSSRVTT